ncbi:MAG: radical SAM protein [Acidobacteriota bacterium]
MFEISDIIPGVMDSRDSLTVNEIFFSIQGESTRAGLPCVFVRLARCNLRCTYCDTEYAFDEGEEMCLEDIIRRVNQFPTDLVEITGGEPLLQPAVLPLIEELLDGGKKVLIETGGSIDVRPVDSRAILIYDIKCPDSGMMDRNLWENLSHLKPNDEVKFVLASRRDYEWAKQQLAEWDLVSRYTVLFSPVWDQLNPRELAEWVLQDGLAVRLQVQLHKVLWGKDVRGV